MADLGYRGPRRRPVSRRINFRVDATNEVAEMGYPIARTHWNRGYILEAAGAGSWPMPFTWWVVAEVAATAHAESTG